MNRQLCAARGKLPVELGNCFISKLSISFFISTRNSDELEEDCFERSAKELDFQSPLQPNAHLYNYGSNLALSDFENSSGLAPKTQK